MKLVRPVRPLLAASAGVVLLSLAACGGGSDSKASDSSSTSGSQQGGGSASGQNGAAGQGRLPGANGLVAAISGKTLQVQGQSGQTAVSYTASTTFTAQVAATLADVKAGSCVMVTPVQDDSAASGSADSGQQTQVTAASVRITAAENGTCTGGFGGGAGPAGDSSGMPTDMPTDMPSAVPSGAPSRAPSGAAGGAPGGSGRGGRGFGAFGEVASVSANGFTVTSQAPAASGSSSTATTVQVTVSGTTTYTTTQKSSAKALAVGKCVSASGDSDDTGALTAQRITVSDAVDGQCTGGFGAPGGRQDGASS